MKLTTRGRYAVTAMLDLALNGDKGPISLAAISLARIYRCHILSSYLPSCVRMIWSPACVAPVEAIG